MKVGRNQTCPCGSGKKYKKCCLDKEYDIVQPVKEVFNPRFNRFETNRSHKYVQGYYNGATFSKEKEHQALLKCKLLHSNGFSVILPDFIILKTGWIQPLHFLAPRLVQGDDDIICDINVDISGEQSLQIRITNKGFVRSLDDGSQLFECSISGPKDLEDYCGGQYKKVGDDILLQLFHHTDSKGAKGIINSGELWSSPWNYRGTGKKCVNYNHIYFTHIPEIKYNSDLITVAMSNNGTINYATDNVPTDVFFSGNTKGYENEIYVAKVYRESSKTRTHSLPFWVDVAKIDSKHVYYHNQGGAVFYELCFPYIHRVKTTPNAKISFDENFILNTSSSVKNADYSIIGDCTSIEGLKAPFDEENTTYTFTTDDCGGLNMLDYWFQNGNEPLYFPDTVDIMQVSNVDKID